MLSYSFFPLRKKLDTCFLFFTIFLYLVTISVNGHAQYQDINFDHLSLDDGLSQSTVFAITQDSFGFMWFATANGLNRYNGYDFTVFQHNPDDSTTISNDYITAMFEDSDHNLWIGTTDGLNVLDLSVVSESKFQRYRHAPGDKKKLSHNYIECIFEDQAGTLWIGTASGLNRFEHSTKSIIPIAQTKRQHISSLYEDKAGHLWVGTARDGLNKFMPDRKSVIHYGVPVLSSNSISAMAQDRAGHLWVGTNDGGLIQFQPESDRFVTHKKSGGLSSPESSVSIISNYINSLLVDRNGKLWIGTGQGLSIFDPITRQFMNYRHHLNEPGSLSANSVHSLWEDRSGIVWLGTVLGGLNKFSPLKYRFENYASNPASLAGTTDKRIYAFSQTPDGLIWVGSWDGLQLFDPISRTFQQDHLYQAIFDRVGHRLVLAILFDSEGEIWIGTEGGGLFRANLTDPTGVRHYLHEPENPESVSSNRYRTIVEDSRGTLWFGTMDGGLNRFDRQKDLFYQYRHDALVSLSLDVNHVKSIFEDRSGRFWIGTDGGGLNLFDQEKGVIGRFKNEQGNRNSLSNNTVTSVYEDGAGYLWIATYGGGLNKYDLRTNFFQRYNREQGLPNNVVYGIIPDDEGNLWLSTNKGLSCFDPAKETFINFDVDDGLQSNEFSTGGFFKSSSGQQYFGGVNGFTVFHPENVPMNTQVPPVAITGMKKHDTPVDFDRNENSEVRLTHRDNFLSFEFVTLDYTNSKKNRYAYMLEGFDETWRDADSRRFATYTNLDPGKYIFRVKGANGDGIWNEKGAFLKLTILPPWWQMWWFRSFVIGTIIFFVFGLYRFRIQNLEKQRRRLQSLVEQRTHDLQHQKEIAETAKQTIEKQARRLLEMDEAKSRFFANISHEFRTPLTLILGPLEEMMVNGYDDKSKRIFHSMHQNAGRLLRLIEQLLDLATLETHNLKLKVRDGDFVAFIRETVGSFTSLAECKKVDLKFDCDLDKLLCLFDQDKIEKIMLNLLSNAFKFTPETGRITVQLTVDKQAEQNGAEMVVVTVSDTGKGIPSYQLSRIFDRFYRGESSENQEQGTGIGLALTKELVALHGGKISLNSLVNTGTEFRVLLPLQRTTLHQDSELKLKKKLISKNGNLNDSVTEKANSDGMPLILLIDDNPDIRDFIKQHMKNRYDVNEAEDGLAGFEMAVKILPDLIVSDVMMPGIEGIELCHKLKSDERTSHIPVILLTARATEKSKLRGLETGADDYITKPFKTMELEARVKNLIEQRRMLRRKFSKELFLRPDEITVTSVDAAFLKKACSLANENLADPDFTMDEFVRKMGMSATNLHRKLRALTDQSPSQFVRTMRLKRARQLLEQRTGNVAEIAYAVGFNNLSYFSKCFREHFGHAPSKL